jgi:TRAP-type C4-dicarboxylate transport system permease small subunit
MGEGEKAMSESIAAEPAAEDEHVLGADGEFHARDAPIDLSVYRFEDWIALAFFATLAATVFYQFFTRYALNDSASWTEEIARYLLICVTFVGAIGVVRHNKHIQVDVFYRILPARVTRVMSTAVDIVRVLFLGYAAWLTWLLLDKIGKSRMSIVDLPVGLVYSVVLFGFAGMCVRAIQVGIRHWRQGFSILERPEVGDGEETA